MKVIKENTSINERTCLFCIQDLKEDADILMNHKVGNAIAIDVAIAITRLIRILIDTTTIVSAVMANVVPCSVYHKCYVWLLP